MRRSYCRDRSCLLLFENPSPQRDKYRRISEDYDQQEGTMNSEPGPLSGDPF